MLVDSVLCKQLQNTQNGFSQKEIIHNDNKSVSRIKTAGTKNIVLCTLSFLGVCTHFTMRTAPPSTCGGRLFSVVLFYNALATS